MKKLGLIIAALALVLGLSQCRKPNISMLGNGYHTKTITFSNSDNGGQKGDFQESVDGLLNYHWVAGDVIHVYYTTNEYKNDGTTDFTTNSGYCGTLNKMKKIDDTKAQFSGAVNINDNAKALRFVHYGQGVSVTKGAATVNFAEQTGLLTDVSNKVVAYCDKKYDGVAYDNCKLIVAFGVVRLSFEKFTDNDYVTMEKEGNTVISVTSGGAISYTTNGTMKYNFTNTRDETNNKKNYYTVLLPRERTFYKFSRNNDCSYLKLKIEENKYYRKAAGESIALSLVPDGALPCAYEVYGNSDPNLRKYVMFSKGNLYYDNNGSRWNFEANQYDFRTYSGLTAVINGSDATTPNGDWGLFGWSTPANDYGRSTSILDSDYYGDFREWGENTSLPGNSDGKVWGTLTRHEWEHLLIGRKTNATVGGVNSASFARVKVNGRAGVLIFSYDFEWDETTMGTAPKNVNVSNASDYDSNYSTTQFSYIEGEGAVFLPVAKGAEGGIITNDDGFYWSSTPTTIEKAGCLHDESKILVIHELKRIYGFSVRLACDVK